jgi:AraC family transcriptional regulator
MLKSYKTPELRHTDDGIMVEKLQPGQWYGTVERSQTIGGVLLSIVYHDRPRSIGIHEHTWSYFLMPYAGGYRESKDGVTIDYEPFSIAFHPAGFVHSDEVLAPERFFAIELQTEWQMRSGHLYDPSAWRFELQHGEAVWLAIGLLQRFLAGELDDVFEVDAIVAEMLGIALRLVDRDRPQRAWVNDVKRLLREEYANKVSLEEIAARIGIHPASLSRGFRLDEGITISEYLSRVRIQQACRQMSDRSVTLAQLAANCGFADQSHLTRVFKSITGSPPGVFRDLLGGVQAYS